MDKRTILIWTKTYPELSNKYLETVCTAGVLEDGKPVRLYPIPYRYLEGENRFHKYQWVTANIERHPQDPRPESYRIDCDSIECGEIIPTSKDEWGIRAQYVFIDRAWQFNTVDELQQAQDENRTSLGVVVPREIQKIEIVKRPDEDALSFEQKFQELCKIADIDKAQMKLFEDAVPKEMKGLEYMASRPRIHWLCNSAECKGHKMQILDWEILELQRREGDDNALKKLEELCNLTKYDLRFFLGNLHQHPKSFTIIGLWYPQRSRNLLLWR
jgi:hypothetical protein